MRKMNMILQLITVFMLFAASPIFAQEPKPTVPTPEQQRAQWIADSERLASEGYRLYQNGKFVEALDSTQQFLDLRRKLYPVAQFPDGHADLASALNGMGLVLAGMGDFAKARPYYEQALAMRRKVFPLAKYPAGHPHLAISLNNIALVRKGLGDFEGALPYYEQALAMFRTLYPRGQYPDGQAELATCLNNLGTLHMDMAMFDKARPLLEEALAMRTALFTKAKFPNGHPQVATSLNVLGMLLQNVGLQAKGLQYLEESLAMRRLLLPEGHPDLLNSLLYVAARLPINDELDKALTLSEEALKQARKQYDDTKYPIGHPLLIRSLEQLGTLHARRGQVDTAISLLDEALSLHRKLYPLERYADGGYERVKLLTHLAMALQAKGADDLAVKRAVEALALQKNLLRSAIASASEAGAFAFFTNQYPARNFYLSVARPDTDVMDQYRSVWDTKSSLTRILEMRRIVARSADSDVKPKLDRLQGLHLQIERLIQPQGTPPRDRDRLLALLSDERDTLERELAKRLPVLEHFAQRDRLGPTDLLGSLPPHTVFIDFCFYIRHQAGEGRKTAQQQTPSYMAFVLAAGQPPRLIDLGNVDPIDEALAKWLQAIRDGTDQKPASETLSRRLWQRLAAHVPAGTRTLYIAPDGNLPLVPWAALPGTKPGTVLLEEFANGIAIVPHGPFLLEQLKFPKTAPTEASAVLAIGNLTYDQRGSLPSIYPALPGTNSEIKSLLVSGGQFSVTALTGNQATATRLREELPNARFVHLATHGFFAEKELAEQKQQAQDFFLQPSFRQGGAATRVTTSKNPLAYTGLILSGSEVMTGLSIANLSLEKLRLVTLSACETGLGELTAGEGVQGLQRAFHLAGCPNVIASLWKVNDAATAALMAKFYHELWVNKKLPIEALREAQLMIYRRPDLIPDLAGERGAPNLKKAIEVKSVDPIPKEMAEKKTADTKLWAAFVLSGVGK